ncbi:transposase [Nocardia brasiliensis]
MARPRRSYSPEYRVEAAHRVIDSGRSVREIARELDVHENLLHKWVREERRRMAAADRPARSALRAPFPTPRTPSAFPHAIWSAVAGARTRKRCANCRGPPICRLVHVNHTAPSSGRDCPVCMRFSAVECVRRGGGSPSAERAAA